MHRIKEKLRREIDEIGSKPGELSHGDLETLNKLTDALKDIETICAMEEADEGDYSERRHYVRAHYSRDGMPMEHDGYSGRRRDSRGRYVMDGHDVDRDGRGEMARHLESAAAMASRPEDREMIERMLDKMR